jgi:two-component system alkaline phosphatase synthesis response regulator PhoP
MARIMVLDDEPDTLEMLEKVFKKQGYKFSGYLESEEFLKKYPKEKPDLVMLDIMVPKMNGIEVCKKIRTMNKKQKAVFLSVLEPTAMAEVDIPGAKVDYIEKPFDPKDLLEKVNGILKQ